MQISTTVTVVLAATLFLMAGSASATLPRVWVSGHGVDGSGCGAPTAPCRSLQYAHDHAVAEGGEIDILDPAGYGAIAITKAISIVNDGVGTAGVQSTNGIAINITANPGDSIYLRGLNIDGVNFTGLTGVQFNTGASLTMVGCVVRHFKNYGIALAPQDGGARINISDSISSENRAGGILFSPPVGAVSSYAALNRITVQGNGANGLTILGSGTTGLVSTLVSNSNFSNNTGDGINVQSANNFNTNLNVESSQFYANSYGLEVYTGVTRLSNVFAQENINGDLNNGVDQDTMFGVFSYGDNEIGSKSGAAMATLSQQ
jgi:hypothetical protein